MSETHGLIGNPNAGYGGVSGDRVWLIALAL